MPRLSAALLLISLAFGASADDRRIGTIDFYGYADLDLDHLRSLLPFHEGDPLPSRQALDAAASAYAKAIGQPRVVFGAVCCLPDGRYSVFAGMPQPGAPPLVFNPQPKGNANLPAEVVKLYRDIGDANSGSTKINMAGEDDSRGYSLSEYAPQRKLELQLRDYALAHTSKLIQVLQSSATEQQRAAAAEALGYADESEQQIAALVDASLDPDGEVRNNAIRALGVLVEYDPKALRHISLKPYIALIHSIDWTDRNKAGGLIDSFTKSRDPEVLRTLRQDALGPLREMAQWQDTSHALDGIMALARIAGMDEQRLIQVVLAHNVAAILDALH